MNPLQRGCGWMAAAAPAIHPAALPTSMVTLVSAVALLVTATLVGGSGSPGDNGETGK